MKHWMAVHTFVDESAKLSYHKYMAEVEELKTKDGKSFTQSDWAKESTGEFATVLQKWIGTAEFFFSHCLADSEDNIIKQLEVWGVINSSIQWLWRRIIGAQRINQLKNLR